MKNLFSLCVSIFIRITDLGNISISIGDANPCFLVVPRLIIKKTHGLALQAVVRIKVHWRTHDVGGHGNHKGGSLMMELLNEIVFWFHFYTEHIKYDPQYNIQFLHELDDYYSRMYIHEKNNSSVSVMQWSMPIHPYESWMKIMTYNFCHSAL